MQLDSYALTKYGAPVHHVLRCLLSSPDGQVSLQDIDHEPWLFHLAKPSLPTLRKTLHEMTTGYKFIERVSRGVYRLSPELHLSGDAVAHLKKPSYIHL
jgi:hypothetical protein